MTFDAEKTKNEIVEWIRKFFEENGSGCNAIVGISGGKDSTIVAALCVEALGEDRVFGVIMPNGEDKDIEMAYEVVNHLGIDSCEINIKDAVGSIRYWMQDKEELPFSTQTETNLPPRIRMSVLYAVSQSMNGRVANTCNLSEDWVGYSTRYGDSVGDFSPLSRLTVTEVKQIGYVLGLPENFIEKIPADGLCGKTDEDNLGFSYDVLDRYIRTGKIQDEVVKKKIDHLHEKNLFKLQMMSCFEYRPDIKEIVLWIDDTRQPPSEEGYIWCKGVNEAKLGIMIRENKIYKTFKNSEQIIMIDLDHDAGDYAFDGGDYIELLEWLEETGRNYPIHIHSMNPVGIQNMRRIIERNGWTEVR